MAMFSKWYTLRANRPKDHRRGRARAFRPLLEALEARLALSTFTVLNTNDSGADSLRQAILDANANPGPDTIAFNIAVSGVQTIAPLTPLPPVTGAVVIDGTTEGGFTAAPLIVIDGSNTAAGSNGLVIAAGNSTVRGLAIVNFLATQAAPVTGGIGIQLLTGGGNVITGNYLGIDSDGTTARGNTHGLEIDGSAGNTIGGTTAGTGNVISGNLSNGFGIVGPNADNNTVAGNFIGADAAGTVAVPNLLGGMSVDKANGTVIGGPAAAARNVISGNSGLGSSGLFLSDASNSTIQGNFIGVDRTGEAALGNPFAGVLIQRGSGNHIVGNVLSANVTSAGLVLAASNNNVVQGNFIGTDAAGTKVLGNGFAGVLVGSGSTGNTIGGTTAGTPNVISGNGFNEIVGPGPGVMLINPGTSNNTVLGNFIGTDVTGTLALGNCVAGVLIFDGATNNTVGGTAAGSANLIAGNAGTSRGLFGDGVILRDVDHNFVIGNRIGTNLAGTSALPNHGNGVLVMNATDNTVGGAAAGASNLLSGNTGAGVRVTSLVMPPALAAGPPQAGGTLAPGTYFYVLTATNAAGETTPSNEVTATVTAGNQSVPLTWGALDLATGYKLYRGTTAGHENVLVATISGGATDTFTDTGGPTTPATPPTVNTAVGPDATRNVIQGNLIGTNVTGGAALGNGEQGVVIDSGTANTIGGTTAAAANLISGNGLAGVAINGPAANNNVIQGNLIGTDKLGTTALPNHFGGIAVVAPTGTVSGTVIGGTAAATRNVVAGNAGPDTSGIFLKGAVNSTIQGNYVGVDATGAAKLGAIFAGILIQQGGNNLIGGTAAGAGNVLSGNVSSAGLVFNGSSNNTVQGNFIGTDFSGTVALGNGGNGVLIAGDGLGHGSNNNIVGEVTSGGANVISGNGFLARTGAGVAIILGSTGNQVTGNFIGTDRTGTKALGNAYAGVLISDADGNTIGDFGPGVHGNIIAGTEGGPDGTFGDGVLIRNAANNVVKANLIGTDLGGTVALPNHGDGVRLMNAPTNTVGAALSQRPVGREGNLIAANGGAGVRITSLLNAPVLHALAVTGTGLAPGIYYYMITSTSSAGETTPSSEVGVTVTAADGNVLLDWDPVDLATGYKIYRGTSPGKENVLVAAIPNGNAGEFADTGGSTTPATPPATNTAVARAANGNVIQGNAIGTDNSGAGPLPNVQGGVVIQAANSNLVGGTGFGDGNLSIELNANDGVTVDTGTGNAILGNSIFANKGLGIHLLNGGNNNQPAPVLSGISRTDTDTVVAGTLAGAPNTQFTLEFFESPPAPTPVQGRVFLTRASVTTDGNGAASFSITLGTVVPFGEVVTATATDAANNTSPFSNTAGAVLAVGADAGGGPQVRLLDATSQAVLRAFFPYDPAFTGGVRVALGDINGDGVPDIVTAAGPGGGPDIKVFDGASNSLLRQFFAFDQNFTGGVYVAVGDVNGDGFGDIIIGADAGGGPNVSVFSGKDGSRLLSFFAYDQNFTGGVRVAAGDVNGDGKADIVCGAGAGGGPNVTIFSGADGSRLASFFTLDPAFTAGIYVAAGDVNGDGKADVIAGAGSGGGPNVTVFSNVTAAQPTLLDNFFAYAAGFTGGVRVAAGDVNGDGLADIIAGAGPGGGPNVSIFNGPDASLLASYFAFDPGFTGGIYVAAQSR